MSEQAPPPPPPPPEAEPTVRLVDQPGRWVSDLRFMLAFMTRIPVAVEGFVPHERFASALRAGPLVGIVVGGVGGLVYWAAASLIGPGLAAAALALAAMALITGGLHEDALGDVADGFGGGATRERKLEIMRDSRLGSYGALALTLGLLIKAGAIEAVSEPRAALAALIAGAAMSRAAMVAVMAALPAARGDGLSARAGRPSLSGAVQAGALGAVACFVFLSPLAALLGILACLGGGVLVAALAWRQIGGQTGDVLGASQQIAEIAFLLAIAAASG